MALRIRKVLWASPNVCGAHIVYYYYEGWQDQTYLSEWILWAHID
jgi:hypothetical protein